MLLSLIIPAFNEEERLPRTLDDYLRYLSKQNYAFEVIVVDDGSTDSTVHFLQREYSDIITILVQPQNKGKGAAVRLGVQESHGDLVIFADADGSTPIGEIEKLLDSINQGADVAIGSRTTAVLVGKKQPFYRILMGMFFNYLVRALMRANINDTQCGFKLLKGNIAREIFSKMKLNGFSFDVELLYLLSKAGYKIVEVPVVWINDARSKVNVFTDPIKMFFDLLRIKFMHP